MDGQIDTLRMRARLSGSMWTDVVWFDEIDSTNRWLVDEANAGRLEAGTVAIAGTQSAGRGRLGRTWTAPAGSALLMSVYVTPDVALDRWPLLTFAVAMAVRETAAHVAAPGTAIRLKWPNDVIVESDGALYLKLCGVLAEATPTGVVIGCGVNLHRPTDLPEEFANTGATPCWLDDYVVERSTQAAGNHAVVSVAGSSVESFSTDVLIAVDRRIAQLGLNHVGFLADYRTHCATLGSRVRVHRGDGSTTDFYADDIDAVGRLIVSDGEKRETLSAGDVEHLRPLG